LVALQLEGSTMASRNFEPNCDRGIPMFGMAQSIDVTGNMCEGKEIDRFPLKRRNRLDIKMGRSGRRRDADM
jgi:hypothetical protein